jgi:hypothetical protein
VHAPPARQVEIMQGWFLVMWFWAQTAHFGWSALHSLGWWPYPWQLLHWEAGFQEKYSSMWHRRLQMTSEVIPKHLKSIAPIREITRVEADLLRQHSIGMSQRGSSPRYREG